MAIRIALFVILIMLGFIMLYWATRNKWNWGESAKPMFATMAVLLMLPILMTAYMVDQNKATVLHSFNDIALGSDKADVMFIKGEPKKIIEGVWLYDDLVNKFNSTRITFNKQDKVQEISYQGTCEYCNRISGMGIGSDLNSLEKKFGHPSQLSLSENGLERRAEFKQFQSFFVLQKNSVISFGIFKSIKPEAKNSADDASEESLVTPEPNDLDSSQTAPKEPKRTTTGQVKIRKDLSQPFKAKQRD